MIPNRMRAEILELTSPTKEDTFYASSKTLNAGEDRYWLAHVTALLWVRSRTETLFSAHFLLKTRSTDFTDPCLDLFESPFVKSSNLDQTNG